MNAVTVLAAALLLTFSPVFVNAQGFGIGGDSGVGGGTAGCSARGESCYSAAGPGICAQDPEYGTLYCRPNALNTGPGAGGGGGINTFYLKSYSQSILSIINGLLVPILLAVAFIVFLWGVFRYFVWGGDSDESLKTGRNFVLWGIIGFVVILSVWGLVNLLGTTFGLSAGGRAPAFPTL